MQKNQTIFESMFNRNFSDPGNAGFLKEITDKHPYFSPAQFFLLQKNAEGSNTFNKQVCKANILFNNPHWLNFQLLQTSSCAAVSITQKNAIINIAPVVAEEEPLFAAAHLPNYEDEEIETITEEEIEPMKIELKLPEERNNHREELLFEPMHMVDYFASQGIKLSDDVQPADKLGKQMKSFTEWLKTMKKVHERGALPDTQNEALIQTLAEKSNTENEVLTISMADVFVKQGKNEKAREIFEKLSLLNPAKSAYFAAKIENLK